MIISLNSSPNTGFVILSGFPVVLRNICEYDILLFQSLVHPSNARKSYFNPSTAMSSAKDEASSLLGLWLQFTYVLKWFLSSLS